MSSPSERGASGLWTRRKLLVGLGAVTAATAGYVAYDKLGLREPRTRVMTLAAANYEIDLVDTLLRGIREFPNTVARVKGANVVLKPNLVEWSASRPVNTNPRLIAAAIEAFRKLDAKSVVVAEGPGHVRDMEMLLDQSGLAEYLKQVGASFIDLNIDRRVDVPLRTTYTKLETLPIAATIAGADFVVSMPKLKTHHWAGVTLSMKNLFGTVPSAVVGWPKNPLHWAGIEASIVDLWTSLQPGFAIVDGIVGMEGDGPIRGDAVEAGVLVLGEQGVAVDATAARHMGVDPHQVGYLAVAGYHGGTLHESRIENVGDLVAPRAFRLLDTFAHLRLKT